MSSIKSKNTLPEITVRRSLWTAGKRYRIHTRDIYGTPDISHKGSKLAVFIDGCFWHGCKRCYSAPKTNSKFWTEKIKANKRRRAKVLSELKSRNWKVLEFWEHEIMENPSKVSSKIAKFLP